MDERMWRANWIVKDESDPSVPFNILASDPPGIISSDEIFPEKDVDRLLQEISSVDPLESEIQMSFLRDAVVPIIEPLYYHHCDQKHANNIAFEEIERMCREASTMETKTTHYYQPWRI